MIFLDRWLFAGHVSQLSEPGQYFLFQIGAENIILLRDRQDKVRAFYNVCRHRGARLCSEEKGQFQSGIQCQYHAWTYELSGALMGAPEIKGSEGFSEKDYPLHPVEVRVWEGLIFVNLAESPTSFEETFSFLMGKFTPWQMPALQSVHQTLYAVAANWKLLFQNYSECYHCPNVHPALNQLTPYRDSDNDLTEGPFLGGPMRLAREGGSMTMTGQRCADPIGELSGESLNSVHYYTLFPNLFLSLHPDYVLVHRLEPQALDRTRVHCNWDFPPEAISRSGFDPEPAIEFWDMTNQQDWHLCSISQLGIASRAYTPGPYSDLESQLAAFDREYLKALGHDAPELVRV